ncbi:MAG: hypothetical protein WCJ12_09860 [Burkholderiaceae bacterium]
MNAIQVQRVMGCSAEDLIRWLPNALGELLQSTSVVIDDKTHYDVPSAALVIAAHTKPAQQIALLKIPVLEVNFSFAMSAFNAEQVAQVIAKFDLYTRRGGG